VERRETLNREQLFYELVPPLVARRLRRSRLPLVGARPLHRIDKSLAKYLPDSGTYIELGANDGLTQSNTWWLEREREWSGLLIEPALNQYLQLVKNRSPRNQFRCVACVPRDYSDAYVRMTYADLMSTTTSDGLINIDIDVHYEAARQHAPDQVEFYAPARTISDVIDECELPSHVDFMSLDVEGAELSVLQGFDFERHTLGHLLVETRDVSIIADFLSDFGYRQTEQISGHDYLFVMNPRD